MTTNREQLILDLRRIEGNSYNASSEEVAQYTDMMLRYIGDTDPVLRDDLIYNTFSEWICEKEYFCEKELLNILSILTDESHLFCGIGKDGDETVFTRTFSILAVVLILIQHRKKAFLTDEKFIQVKNSIIRYYQEERDLRGYTDGNGWAHGAAHGADALDELVQCEESGEEIFKEIFESIKKILYNGKYLFHNEEDERIARVVYRMIKRKPAASRLLNDWFDGLSQCCDWDKTRKQYIARVNTKNFVRCLYFKLVHNKVELNIADRLLEVEAKLNRFLQFDKDI